MEPIIRIEQLSKRYTIGSERIRYPTLRANLAAATRAPLKRWWNNDSRENTLWALKDVSFDVKPGEVVGIIGRNGAGKSTLLKLLSRITKPTSGRIALYGRVGSLLEVGTGFHPELTGRENIYLNGAILGMSRAEIDSKFDEIVAFAEIKRFLNTPVKHYSSGMYVRLAFAVAAHLEPEILVVDEVLAVGDAAFQKKCLGKMNDIAKKGRTVLFVSHDISAITSLCERVVLLHEGEVLMNGETNRVVAHYLDRSNKLYTPITWSSLSGVSDAEIEFLSGSVVQDGVSTTVINCREPFDIEFKYRVKKPVPNCRLFLIIRNGKGEIVFTTSDYDQLPENGIERSKGTFVTRVYTPGELLKTGSYYVSFGADIKNERIVSCADDAVPFDVFEPEDDTLAERHRRVGVIAPLLEWRTEAVSPDSNAG